MSNELTNEIDNWIKRNNGDGYNRIIGLVNSYKEEGLSDEAIVEILRNLNK